MSYPLGSNSGTIATFSCYLVGNSDVLRLGKTKKIGSIGELAVMVYRISMNAELSTLG